MKSNDHLDDIDRRILRELQADAGLSHTALSDRVGASPASCWRRIKALEEVGVLGPPVRLVRADRVGRGVSVMLHVRLKTHALDQRDAFETFVRAHAEIVECYSMSGEWDYLLRIVVADVADYERFLMRELLNHPNVATSASHFALNQVKYTTAIPV